ncbi:hypothetical protein B0H12DRAFT_1119955 [Mycena haematopus]|nr:hypothetical protein B0H12DRAFT_1119955 [Mycena haematopus]
MCSTSRGNASTAFLPTARYVGLRDNHKLGLPRNRIDFKGHGYNMAIIDASVAFATCFKSTGLLKLPVGSKNY